MYENVFTVVFDMDMIASFVAFNVSSRDTDFEYVCLVTRMPILDQEMPGLSQSCVNNLRIITHLDS